MAQGRHWLDTKEYWFVRIRVRELNALIAKHYRAFWLAQEEKGPKLRARGIVYLALGFERKLHFLTQRRSEKTSSINKLESICNWTVFESQYGRKNPFDKETTGTWEFPL